MSYSPEVERPVYVFCVFNNNIHILALSLEIMQLHK